MSSNSDFQNENRSIDHPAIEKNGVYEIVSYHSTHMLVFQVYQLPEGLDCANSLSMFVGQI